MTSQGSYDKFQILGEVEAGIERILMQIANEIKPHSSYQSKFNAAESMLKIFEAVMYERSEACHELIDNHQQWDSLFCDVFACFQDGELLTLAAHPVAGHHRRHTTFDGNYEDVGWLGRLQKFVERAQRYGFVIGVEDTYHTLRNAVFGDPLDDESLERDEGLEEDEGLENEDLEADESLEGDESLG